MAEQQKQEKQTQEQNLKGRKVAILVTDGFEQVELTEPRKAPLRPTTGGRRTSRDAWRRSCSDAARTCSAGRQ